MSDTLFTAGTVVASSWLNDVDKSVYSVLAAVAGTNTITANGPLPVTSYTRGLRFFFTPANTNTGAVTLNVNGLGPKALNRQGSVPLVAGDIVTGSTVVVFYDGVQFQLLAPYQGALTGIDTYVTTGGTTTAYTLTIPDAFSRNVGAAVKLVFNATNTSTTPTFNVNGTGAAAIKVMSAAGVKVDPIVGAFGINIPATAIWDGTNWLVAPEYPSGRLLNTQTFTANGTYTPTPGTTSIVVEAIGGGGQGGGAPATGAGAVSLGSGGGSGGYSKGKFAVPAPTAVTIGPAGSGGGAGANGGAGGTTSLGALITALGGGGGTASAAGAQAFSGGGASAGQGTGGNILSNAGSPGATVAGSFGSTIILSGAGGPGPFGGNGIATFSGGGASAGNGPVVGSYGGGGGGASSFVAGAAAGAAGHAGILIVHEYS